MLKHENTANTIIIGYEFYKKKSIISGATVTISPPIKETKLVPITLA